MVRQLVIAMMVAGATAAAAPALAISTVANQEVTRFNAPPGQVKADAAKEQAAGKKPDEVLVAEPDFLSSFDSVLQEVRPISCVIYTGTIPAKKMIAGRDETTHSIATTATELASDKSFTMSAAFGVGIYSGSAAASMLSSSRYSGSSLNAIVKSSWRSVPIALPLSASNIKLDESVRKLLKTDPLAFRRKCGDSFIYSVRVGASVEWTLTISAVTESEKREYRSTIEAAAGAGVGPSAKLSAGISSSMSSLVSRSNTQMSYSYAGDPVSVISGTPGDRCVSDAPKQQPATTDIAAVLNFVSFLDCRTLGGGVVVGFGYLPYSSIDEELGQSSDLDSDVTALMQVFDRWAGLKAYLDRAGDLQSVKTVETDIKAEIAELERAHKRLTALFRSAVRGSPADKVAPADLAEFNALIAKARRVPPPPSVQIFNERSLVALEFPPPFIKSAAAGSVRLTGTYTLQENNLGLSCPGACGPGDNPAFVITDAKNQTTASFVSPGLIGVPFPVPSRATVLFRVVDNACAACYADNAWIGNAGLQYVEAYTRDSTFTDLK